MPDRELITGFHPDPTYRAALNQGIGRAHFEGTIHDTLDGLVQDLRMEQANNRALVLPIGPIDSKPRPYVTRNSHPVRAMQRLNVARSLPWVLIGSPGQVPDQVIYGGLPVDVVNFIPDATSQNPQQQVADRFVGWLLSLPTL